LNKFNGIKKYQEMIGFLSKWLRHLRLELHEIQQIENNSPNKIITRWTLSWQSPLPWEPKIAVSGWSELEVNPEGLISSHVDYWDCSIWDVLIQHVS